MDGITIREVIKALAYGMDIEDIANFAEVTVEEIEVIKTEFASDIQERKNTMEEKP